MKHSRWQLLGVLAVILFAVILATALYRTNIHSPRISATKLATPAKICFNHFSLITITIPSL